MKKIILSLIFFVTTASFINAQDKVVPPSKPTHLSFGFNFGGPLSKTTSALYEFVLGGDLQLAYDLANKINLLVSGGFDVWHGKKAKNSNYIPVLGGVRFYLSDKIFISEQAGYSIGVSKDPITNIKIKGAFTDVAGLGLKIGPNSDVLLSYKGLFPSGVKVNAIDLRVAYNFGK